MQAANISLSYYNYELSYHKIDTFRGQDKSRENQSSADKGYTLSLTAEMRTESFTAVYTKNGNKANKSDENKEIQKQPDDSSKSLGATKAEIKKQIELQTYQLLKQYLDESPELKQSLEEFFAQNPEALEQIQQGEIPEYFNVENTAKRILDIYFSRYNGEDREEFAENAKSIISQAYGEVEGMVGMLPDIVQKTRDKIYEVLDRFANGEDVSDFITLPELSPVNETETE